MLTRWNPWQDVFSVQRDMMETLRRALDTDWLQPSDRLETPSWVPAVDVFSRDGDLVVRADLPGVDPDKDVDITVQDGVLTIRGERRHEARTDGDGFSRFESSRGVFERRLPLPEGVDADDIMATYDSGILEVVVPKAAQLSEPKSIPISAGGGRKALSTKGRKK